MPRDGSGLVPPALPLLGKMGHGTRAPVPVKGTDKRRYKDAGILLLNEIGYRRLHITAEITVMEQNMPTR